MPESVFAAPVDFAVYVVPAQASPEEGLQALLQLVDRGVIDLLDLEVVRRDGRGGSLHISLEDSGLEGLEPFLGADSGLLSDDDVAGIAEDLADDEAAIVIVYQDLSLVPVSRAFFDQGGRLHMVGGIDIAELAAQLDNDN